MLIASQTKGSSSVIINLLYLKTLNALLKSKLIAMQT